MVVYGAAKICLINVARVKLKIEYRLYSILQCVGAVHVF